MAKVDVQLTVQIDWLQSDRIADKSLANVIKTIVLIDHDFPAYFAYPVQPGPGDRNGRIFHHWWRLREGTWDRRNTVGWHTHYDAVCTPSKCMLSSLPWCGRVQSKRLYCLQQITSRKGKVPAKLLESGPDSQRYWTQRVQELAVRRDPAPAMSRKIDLHLGRSVEFFENMYGHDHTSAHLKRDMISWQFALVNDDHAPATINNHLASLSTFTIWVQSHNATIFGIGDPAKRIDELPLPPLVLWVLNDRYQSLKNLYERLETYYRLKGRPQAASHGPAPVNSHAHPCRDRTIVFLLLSTGL